MAGVTDGDNWQANLTILGKLDRGNMLAVASNNGKLERKTNWLTKAANKNKTHDDELFNQIEAVLAFAETKIDENPDENPELIKQYVQANKGLEILLSTYKSKGSKETYLIDKLTLLLAHHVKNFETKNVNVGSNNQNLKKFAEQAIHFVNDCRIRSVNNVRLGGWGNAYFGEKYDRMLFALMVRSASSTKISNPTYFVVNRVQSTTKDLKTILASIVRMPISRNDKKDMLAIKLNELMNDKDCSLAEVNADASGNKTVNKGFGLKWLLNPIPGKYFRQEKITNFVISQKKHPNINEAERIKLAKRAIRYRLGNCLDKACVAATHLIENTKGKIGIVRVGGRNYDHAWVLMSKDKDGLIKAVNACTGRANINYKTNFPRDTWVVDGWTRDWWQLRAWTNSIGNPRQLIVRGKIRKAIKSEGITLSEEVTWPPQSTLASFRLRFAHLTALDWDMLVDKNKADITFSDFRKAVEFLKSMRGDLAQIFPNNMVQNIIGNADVESFVGSAHNPANPRGGVRISNHTSYNFDNFSDTMSEDGK